MKCRRYAPEHLPSIRGGHCTDVGVTFQTDEPHLMPREHPRIRRTVHLVTGAAALQPHRGVLERERSPLVRVASQTARIICCEVSHLQWTERTVRVMAIGAGHRSLGKPVPLWMRPA
jgi:hypothetical protein